MIKPPWVKFLFPLFKISVFVIACYFIYLTVNKNLNALQSIATPNLCLFWISIVSSVIIYALLMMVLVLAWSVLLNFREPKACAAYYFKSQILKYLPGNVFHFAYRHNQTQKLGFGHKELVKTSINETIGLIAASVLTATLLLFWPKQVTWMTAFIPIPLWLIAALALLAILLTTHLRRRSGAYWVLACYLVYFTGMGWLANILNSSLGFEAQAYFFITACFAASWLAGYIIPGAPGGMGVREAVFILLSSPQIAEAEALVLIALIRLISIAAETLTYFIAPILSRPYHHLAAWSDKTTP